VYVGYSAEPLLSTLSLYVFHYSIYLVTEARSFNEPSRCLPRTVSMFNLEHNIFIATSPVRCTIAFRPHFSHAKDACCGEQTYSPICSLVSSFACEVGWGVGGGIVSCIIIIIIINLSFIIYRAIYLYIYIYIMTHRDISISISIFAYICPSFIYVTRPIDVGYAFGANLRRICDGQVEPPVYALGYFIFLEVISTNFESGCFS
jgi:hypothetical protein